MDIILDRICLLLEVDDTKKTQSVYHNDGGKLMNGETLGKDKFETGGVLKKVEIHD